jgi:hypothetical protein
MLTINKGESNEMIVTATEKTTLVDPTFLFVFKNQNTKKVSAFILPDTSDYPEHYNTFTFTEGSNAARTLDTGTNDYTIYAQESTTNIDPDLANEEVEIGIAWVTDGLEAPAEFENVQTFKQFTG